VDETRRIVEGAVKEAGVDAPVTVVPVLGFEDAKEKRCFGSPTIRVDGTDIEYGDREPEEYTAGCRYYNTADGWKPVPGAGMVLRAIREAAARPRSPGL
jgi:hypothetical protein